jgi:bacteriocin biosynthesis cyclodehydratase domain-containing protein
VTAVPQRPLLTPWYRLAGDGERLLLEHGQALVVLEGAAVAALLPALLPLLDGTRTGAELVAELGEAASPALELALETLGEYGLLVEGPDVEPGRRAAAWGIASLLDASPGAVAARLADARVDVVGSSPAGAAVARLLRAAGVDRVSCAGWESSRAVELTVVTPCPEEAGELDGWNRRANARGARWLPVLPWDGRLAAIGPLMVPGESCCYECLRRRRAANLEYGELVREFEATPVAARADPALDAIVAGVAANLALRWLGGGDRSLPGVLHAVEARPALALGAHPVLRVPRCPVCSPVERSAAPLPWHAAGLGAEAA